MFAGGVPVLSVGAWPVGTLPAGLRHPEFCELCFPDQKATPRNSLEVIC